MTKYMAMTRKKRRQHFRYANHDMAQSEDSPERIYNDVFICFLLTANIGGPRPSSPLQFPSGASALAPLTSEFSFAEVVRDFLKWNTKSLFSIS